MESIDDVAEALIIDVRFSSLFLLNQENLNIDTFITSFKTIHLAKIIITDLANCFFEHAISGNNSNLNCYKLDTFTYVTSERYISDEFYGIMIGTRAWKQTTTQYGQYFAYTK